jgi:hypothetical protein
LLKKVVGIVGGVGSAVHVTVLDVVDVLPQKSLAVKVLVWLLEQDELETAPSVAVTVGMPHASVAVAVPSAASTSDTVGLHDGTGGADVNVSVGAVTS